MKKEAHKNGDTPATQADLALLAGEMTRRFDETNAEMQWMRIKLQDVHTDIGRLQRGLEGVLNIVTSIDSQLRELKTLPDRVARLERSRR